MPLLNPTSPSSSSSSFLISSEQRFPRKMQPFDDQSINEMPLELNPNLVPNLSYFPSPTPSTFYASSSLDNHVLFGSIAVENASVPIAAAAAVASADTGKGDNRSIHKGTRKGRHSKICTAKGPRDRRMRLSIDVARNFFRLQDMLGFDKASNTVQWLLTMSKAAIKELASVSSSKICTFKEDGTPLGSGERTAGQGTGESEGEDQGEAKDVVFFVPDRLGSHERPRELVPDEDST